MTNKQVKIGLFTGRDVGTGGGGSSADHHLLYSRAAHSRLRMNISASNGAILKVVGLKLVNRSSVKF